MDKLLTNINGGFPLLLDDFKFIDDSVRNAFKGVLSPYLSAAFGDAVRLSGCDIVSTPQDHTISAGWIYLNGEICKVDAHVVPVSIGTFQNPIAPYWQIVTSVDTNGDRVAENGNSISPYEIRKAVVQYQPTTGNQNTQLLDAERYEHISARISQSIGDIKMSLANLNNFSLTGLGLINTGYYGYAICNGQNGTEDMRGRFPVGYDGSDTDYDQVGKVGGYKAVQLVEQHLPAHDHNTDAVKLTGTTHTAADGLDDQIPNFAPADIANAGNDVPHENRPPFKALLFIQRIF